MNWFEKLFINEAKPALNRHSGGTSGGTGGGSDGRYTWLFTDEVMGDGEIRTDLPVFDPSTHDAYLVFTYETNPEELRFSEKAILHDVGGIVTYAFCKDNTRPQDTMYFCFIPNPVDGMTENPSWMSTGQYASVSVFLVKKEGVE